MPPIHQKLFTPGLAKERAPNPASNASTRSEPETPRPPGKKRQKKPGLAWLTLGAVGVVFGDIGTSPLYALRQCFQNLHSPLVNPADVLGILSLIFWSLILMVCVKYCTFILRADHDGEGGTLAMLALIHTRRPRQKTDPPSGLILMVLAGSALLYGDGIITPPISVLSAVEGMKIAAPATQAYVVPAALVILFGLFLLQSRGTDTVGKLFGPVMTLWFLAIAALGLRGIAEAPQVLSAFNPVCALHFLAQHGGTGVVVLGGVVLCFTGAEALFADLSHFGRRPIKLAWYSLVLPALVLNYFGEGALLLRHPEQIGNPFFALVPPALLWPAVLLATAASIIASQALISGVFALTEQAIHMGYFPRFRITHTSKAQRGQVYVAAVNYALMIACAAVVVIFQSSDKLGGAYGLAVIGTMMVTSLTFYVVMRQVWRWSRWRAVPLAGLFLLLDASFLAGNLVKLFSGAWLPLVFAAMIFAIFWVWTACAARLRRSLNTWGMPLEDFRREMRKWPHRGAGTGVFLTLREQFVPLVGKNHWLRNLARHEQVLLITVMEEDAPFVPEDQIGKLENLGEGVWCLHAAIGFMQYPDLTRILKAQPREQIALDWDKLVCYLPEVIFQPKTSWWRRRVEFCYLLLRRNSLSAAEYFHVPPANIVLIGVSLDL